MKVNAVAGAITAALLTGNAHADDNAAAEGASSVAVELPTFTVRAPPNHAILQRGYGSPRIRAINEAPTRR